MNTEFFIARRIITDKSQQKNNTLPIINIAITAIAVSLAVMILSVAIVTGFKNEIRSKVIGFGAHIQIVNFDANYSYETVPISKTQDFLPELEKIPGVNHVQTFATKPGIMKTAEDIQVAVIKGIDKNFNWNFFKTNLTEGKTFEVNDSITTNNIVISKYLSSLLKLSVGDKVVMYFVQKPIRMRKFNITGIYETSIEEFDKLFILADIKHIQKLNNWEKNQISGFEILINDFDKLDLYKDQVNNVVGFNYDLDQEHLKVVGINEKFPQIFDWLELQNINVWIILILMVVVAGFNMISSLLILILERTNMIGILKGLGSKNKSIRKIFLYQALYITGRGLLWGNIIGILICVLQYYFGLIKLDPTTYYIDTVPINFNWLYFVLLNFGTLIITYLMLLLPSYIVAKISPVKAIKFN
ncbi:ABC transporter permease [Bacteroidota bacterium]